MQQYPRRSRRFASLSAYLRSFSRMLAAIAVPLPIPVAALRLFPVFSEHARVFPLLTGLLCASCIAAVLHLRHWLGITNRRNSASLRFAPVVLMGLSTWSAFSYLEVLQDSIDVAQVRDVLQGTREFIDSDGRWFSLLTSDPPRAEALRIARDLMAGGLPATQRKREDVLENTIRPPFTSMLLVDYVSVFVTAELAFCLIALRQYYRELLRIPETRTS